MHFDRINPFKNINLFQFSILMHGELVITTGFAIQTYHKSEKAQRKLSHLLQIYIAWLWSNIVWGYKWVGHWPMVRHINSWFNAFFTGTYLSVTLYLLPPLPRTRKCRPLPMESFSRYLCIYFVCNSLISWIIFVFLCILASLSTARNLRKCPHLHWAPHWEFCARFRAN